MSLWCRGLFLFVCFLLFVHLPYRALSYFLAPQDAPNSSSYSNSRISNFSKEASSLYWRTELENKIWELDVLIAPEVSLFLLLSAESTRKHIGVYQPVYVTVSINISICKHLCLYQAQHEFIPRSPSLIFTNHCRFLPCLSVASHPNTKRFTQLRSICTTSLRLRWQFLTQSLSYLILS